MELRVRVIAPECIRCVRKQVYLVSGAAYSRLAALI